MNKLAIRGGKATKTKPFPNWPIYDEKDEGNLIKALKSGNWGRGNRNEIIKSNTDNFLYINKLESMICKKFLVNYALAVSNGTSALDIAIRALGLKKGDEVIVTSYSYIASATCILQSNASPVFADIDLKTWNINPIDIENKITKNTRAILVVHFAGLSANMDEIMRIAKENELFVIEDVAHGFGGEWKGKALGTFGDIGCFSFQESKNVTCGEGGLIITNNHKLYEKLYSYHMTGRFLSGKWYEHHYLGWNARMTEFQAAIACSQIEKFDKQHALRNKNAHFLREQLSKIEGITLKEIDKNVTAHAYHIFNLRYEKKEWNNLSRSKFIRSLNCEGIPCHIGYLYPIYKNPLFTNYFKYNHNTNVEGCKNAEQICDEAIWIPQHVLLGDFKDMNEIVYSIQKIKLNLDELGV